MQSTLDKKASQLVAASERLSFDPFAEIDWSVPLDDTTYHLPPEFLPLYGTRQWDAMTDTERKAYSRHEAAALCGSGIWFENLLMQLLLQYLAELPSTDASHRYLLVEIADECRHSQMFGEYIRRAGTPAYTPSLASGLVGSARSVLEEASPLGRVTSFMLVLGVEELLDVCNRATMKDERVNPVGRAIARIHVLEEARHVSFARTFLAQTWPTLSALDQRAASNLACAAVAAISGLLVNPAVYETLGIEGGTEAARTNPFHQARVTRDLTRLTEFLSEIGVINVENRSMWEGLGLVA